LCQTFETGEVVFVDKAHDMWFNCANKADAFTVDMSFAEPAPAIEFAGAHHQTDGGKCHELKNEHSQLQYRSA
jgi:hypothetical protein